MIRRGKMFCSIYKWKISQSFDSGKPISGLLQRHLQKCGSCRKYAEFCTSLKPKFTQDKQNILEDFDESMNKKIMAAIYEKPDHVSETEKKAFSPSWLSRKPILIPSLTAAASILVIVIGLLFFVLLHPKPTPPIDPISTLISAASPVDVLSKVESPLEKEYTELKRAFESTGKYLISSLDLRIGQQAK
jgi:hypothetical protein